MYVDMCACVCVCAHARVCVYVCVNLCLWESGIFLQRCSTTYICWHIWNTHLNTHTHTFMGEWQFLVAVLYNIYMLTYMITAVLYNIYILTYMVMTSSLLQHTAAAYCNRIIHTATHCNMLLRSCLQYTTAAHICRIAKMYICIW